MGDAQNQPPQNDQKHGQGRVILLVVALGLIGYFIYNSQRQQAQNNQVKPPPGVQPNPMVQKIPDLTGEMRKAKTLCEDLAVDAKQRQRQGRIKQQQLDEGRKLYIDARAEYNGCIDDLQQCLERGFVDSDGARIAEKLEKANGAMMGFTSW